MGTTRIRRGAGSTQLLSTRNRLVAILVAVVMATTGTVLGTTAPAVAEDNYPTWNDLQAARNNVTQTEALVKQIEAALVGLQAEADRTAADAAAKSNLWVEANNKFQAAASRADTLQAQADAASVVAEASNTRASQIVAQMMRGSQDLTANLLISGDGDNLLNGLSMSGRISQQAEATLARALFDKNTAQAQTDAAEVAKKELEGLKNLAEAAFQEAQAASLAAGAAVEAQQENQNRLQAQLTVLREKRDATQADYEAGVRARYAKASIEAGQISESGWVQPARGYISSTYGWRLLRGQNNLHTGTDLANPCGTPIYAASSGTVIISTDGYNGGWGTYIVIDHGNGITTGYGHQTVGSRLVSAGEHVDVGQQIGKVGTTGNSTGCHLHFELTVNGRTQDAQPFMRAQGVPLG